MRGDEPPFPTIHPRVGAFDPASRSALSPDEADNAQDDSHREDIEDVWRVACFVEGDAESRQDDTIEQQTESRLNGSPSRWAVHPANKFRSPFITCPIVDHEPRFSSSLSSWRPRKQTWLLTAVLGGSVYRRTLPNPRKHTCTRQA